MVKATEILFVDLEVDLKRVIVFAVVFVVLLCVLITYLVLSRRIDTSQIMLSGIVEADQNDLSFRIPGKISGIYFDEGDHVDSGEVVAELDKSELEAVVDQAEKNYEAAKAGIVQLEVSLETITRNLDKIKSLIPSGAATQSQYDDLFDQKRQIEAQLNYSRKSVDALKASVELAKIRLGYSILASTVKGTVLSRMYEPGEIINAGSPVLTSANLEKVNVIVYLPEINLGMVKLGQEVEILVDSHPDQSFSGKIEHISDKAEFTPKNIQTKAERIKQVFEIKVTSDSHDGVLKPGLPCDVIIHFNQ